MNMVRCSGAQSHFFDRDRYSECPVCGEKEAAINESAAPPKKDGNSQKRKSQKLLMGRKPKPDKSPKDTDKDMGTETVRADHGGTVGFEQKKPEGGARQISRSPYSEERSSDGAPELFNGNENKEYVPAPDGGKDREPDVPYRTKNQGASNDEGKTVGFYNSVQSEPVTGWLVCVKGESVGESYELKTGKNFIGRGAGMDVMLAKEPSVSRDRHAVLTFDPQERIFLIQPGDGNGMVYLNDKLLIAYAELKSRDIIQLGEALFMFYPFCGSEFTWDDYIEK